MCVGHWRQTKAAIRENTTPNENIHDDDDERQPIAPIKCETAIYLKKSTISMGIECCAVRIVIYFYGVSTI